MREPSTIHHYRSEWLETRTWAWYEPCRQTELCVRYYTGYRGLFEAVHITVLEHTRVSVEGVLKLQRPTVYKDTGDSTDPELVAMARAALADETAWSPLWDYLQEYV